MILSIETQRDIRNAALSALYYIAFDQKCEVSDILALLSTTSHTSISGPDTTEPVVLVTTPSQPEPKQAAPSEEPSILPATPMPDHLPDAGNLVEATLPQPTSTPAVQAQNVEPSSEVLDGPSPSLSGAECAAEPVPVPSGGESAGKSGEASASPASPPRGRPETTRAQVIRVHHENPTWPSKLIAEHLSISEDAVRATASRKKLKLVSWWDYQRAQAATKAGELRSSAQPQQKAAEVLAPAAEAATPEPAQLPQVVANAPKRVNGRQDQVLAIHAEHPDWPAKLIAEHMEVTPQYVTAAASRLNLSLVSWAEHVAATATRPETLSDRVYATYAEHPDWSNGRIADHCGCSHSTVSSWLASRRRAAKVTATVEAPDPEPQPTTTPAAAIVPADDDEPLAETAPYRIAPKIAKRAPQGRFYLRDQDGRFVHQSLQASPTGPGPLMTSDRKWGWYDTMDRYRGAKKLWPQIALMRKEGVAQ